MSAVANIETLSSPTVHTVCSFYGVGPQFAHGVLELYAGADYDRNIEDVPKLLQRYSFCQSYLEYALSTNRRGQAMVQQLSGWGVPVRPDTSVRRAYLDVGFAHGGSLVAFAGLGYNVSGIEIQEKYGKLGRANLESVGNAAETRIGDFLSEEAIGGEQKFDLITCTDVIEHVMDPEACLRKICRLLKPGGIAFVAYPNKLCIPYVRADGHSQLFGLTLLDYFRARAAFTMYTGWPEYEVSDYYEPEWYLNTARSAGVSAELVYDDSLPHPDIPSELAQLYKSFSEWTQTSANKLDVLMRFEITRELAKFSTRMFQEYAEHIASNSLDRFARKWMDPLTRLLIRKPR